MQLASLAAAHSPVLLLLCHDKLTPPIRRFAPRPAYCSNPSIPVAPLAIAGDSVAPSEACAIPSSHLGAFLSIVENSRLDLDELVSDIAVKLKCADQTLVVINDESGEEATLAASAAVTIKQSTIRSQVLELAERKSYGLKPSSDGAELFKTDATENACWFWESKVVDFLPKETLGKLVRPARAFRKKIAVRVKAATKVLDVLEKSPGNEKKIKDEIAKLQKIRDDDEAKEAVLKAKNAEKVKEKAAKEEAKIKIQKLKDEAQKLKDAEKVKSEEERSDSARAISNILSSHFDCNPPARRPLQSKVKEAKVTKAKEKSEAENAKQAKLAKQKNMMMGFFKKSAGAKAVATLSVEKDGLEVVAREEKATVQTGAAKAESGAKKVNAKTYSAEESEKFWKSLNSGDHSSTLSLKTTKVRQSEKRSDSKS